MTEISPGLLQALLKKLAATLQKLHSEQCGIMDYQLDATLPALSNHFQPKAFTLCGDLHFMAILEKLLSHTAGLKGSHTQLKGRVLSCPLGNL